MTTIHFENLKTKSKVRARVSVRIAAGVSLGEILVIAGKEGPYVQWPELVRDSDSGRTYRNPVLYFDSDEVRHRWESKILKAFHEWSGNSAGD